MSVYNRQFAEKIAYLCYEKFSSLPKTGKPQLNKEWTTLAAVLQQEGEEIKVISIATGSKCVGKSKLSPLGDIIHDSHAEVLARRGFLRYLYEQIDLTKSQDKSTIFMTTKNNLLMKVKENILFHLFTSHIPCGDASICPIMRSSQSLFKNEEPAIKKSKFEEIVDIRRTGAKCISNCKKQDPKHPGISFHVTGVVRTKPGRGDPTLSVSCSDKILKWNYLGIQGALLSLLIEPVYLTTIIIGCTDETFNLESVKRGLLQRNSSISQLFQTKLQPIILHTTHLFEFSKINETLKPAAGSIIWCGVQGKNHDVCIEGRRLGWTKKSKRYLDPVFVAKTKLFSCFKNITDLKYNELTYWDVKCMAIDYQKMNSKFKNSVENWTKKDINLFKFK